MGLGAGFTFVPSVSITSQHFAKRRSLATGVVMSGSSAGATVFPIMLNHLILKIGFAGAVRASRYVVLGCLVLGNLMIRTRPRAARAAPDIRSFFSDAAYLWTILGALLSTTGIFLPGECTYGGRLKVMLYIAFYSIAIMNGAGAVGWIVGNYFTDLYGPFTLQTVCTFATAATI
ncbi:hypothetical protein B0H14DRAFT_499740 [Mycena olivaceomarginata]|nr:hypothetical protein B0H14DRAFT_499740 [Mycena olivaceomarginata]